MFIIYIIILILIIIYLSYPEENILQSLKYSKIILKDISYNCTNKLLLPPILHIDNLNIIKIKIKNFLYYLYLI